MIKHAAIIQFPSGTKARQGMASTASAYPPTVINQYFPLRLAMIPVTNRSPYPTSSPAPDIHPTIAADAPIIPRYAPKIPRAPSCVISANKLTTPIRQIKTMADEFFLTVIPPPCYASGSSSPNSISYPVRIRPNSSSVSAFIISRRSTVALGRPWKYRLA